MSRTFTTHQQKDKETNFLNGQRACIDPSPDEIYKWFTSTWKDVKYFARQNSINDVRPWAVFRWWWVCALVTNLHLTLRITQIVTCQAPLSMGFPRQECWSGLPFPSPGNLSNPAIKPRSPALQADSSPSEPSGKPLQNVKVFERGELKWKAPYIMEEYLMSDFFKSVWCKQIELVIFIPHKDNIRNEPNGYSLLCLGLLCFLVYPSQPVWAVQL